MLLCKNLEESFVFRFFTLALSLLPPSVSAASRNTIENEVFKRRHKVIKIIILMYFKMQFMKFDMSRYVPSSLNSSLLSLSSITHTHTRDIFQKLCTLIKWALTSTFTHKNEIIHKWINFLLFYYYYTSEQIALKCNKLRAKKLTSLNSLSIPLLMFAIPDNAQTTVNSRREHT